MSRPNSPFVAWRSKCPLTSVVVGNKGRSARPSDSAALAPAMPECGEVSTARTPTSTSSPDGVTPGPRPTTLARTPPSLVESPTADRTACAIGAEPYQDLLHAALATTASRCSNPGS